jgi:hypothetical protein
MDEMGEEVGLLYKSSAIESCTDNAIYWISDDCS